MIIVHFRMFKGLCSAAMTVLLALSVVALVSLVSSHPNIDNPKYIYRSNSFIHKTEFELHTGWTACHASAVIDPSFGCTLSNRRRGNVTVPFVIMNVSKLPTTAMAVLLDNRQIDIANDNNITMENIYYSQNLGKIPDIHITGRNYYTLLYQIEIPHVDTRLTDRGTTLDAVDYDSNDQKVFLKFAGINYRATVWYNGLKLPNLQYTYFETASGSSPLASNIPGMFIRHRYDITPTQLQYGYSSSTNTNTNLVVVMIEPPLHPGYPGRGLQGGSHDLAQDGAVPQYMLGWDWCTSMPDRATGFYGAVTLSTQKDQPSIRLAPPMPDEQIDYIHTLHDPTIQTINISDCLWSRHDMHPQYICSNITLRILVHLEWSNAQQQQQQIWQMSDADTNITVLIESDWGEIWSIAHLDYCETNGHVDLQANITVQDTSNVHLWWPHGVGVSNYAHIHNFTIHLYVNDVITDATTISVGIRTIETYLDHSIQGQRFRVNHHDIYLVGGNWIGTDQALRFSASKQRYCDEIFLHQYAGFNLIRVWGGGTAERDQFYECADQYGILVYQEFWMTGDNNGRWAGNYSWPLDYDAYLMNVEDTIKRLRHHPSLLFYGGCNECLSNQASPWAPNPPRSLDDGIRRLLEKFDPGRFYISSSMGGVCGYIIFMIEFFVSFNDCSKTSPVYFQ
jgi:mannosylglycoprotein endo-beta-mannosidase